MATSSKHDHKNVGCHRIGPPPELATVSLPQFGHPPKSTSTVKKSPGQTGPGLSQLRVQVERAR